MADDCRIDLSLVLEELSAKEREALEVIKEDVCQWLANTLHIEITPLTFFATLDEGVEVCKLAGVIQQAAKGAGLRGVTIPFKVPMEPLSCNAKPGHGTFLARDNTSNFISWCRELGVEEAVIFESEGLVLHKDEKRVILCLLDVARFAERVCVPPPQLVRMEREIELLEAELLKTTDPCTNPIPHTKIHKKALSLQEIGQGGATPGTPPSQEHTTQMGAATQKTPPSQEHTTQMGERTPPSQDHTQQHQPESLVPTTTEFIPPPPNSQSNNITGHLLRRTPKRVARKTQKSRIPIRAGTKISVSRKRTRTSDLEEGAWPSKKMRTEGIEVKDWRRVRDKGRGKVEDRETVKESLDENVMRRMGECTCQNKIEITNCGNGKFIVKGASGRKMTIHARLLSDRLMVRVGGGWDTLDHFLLKHDPCRIHAT